MHTCKALYGLKQESRAWNKTVDEILKAMQMVQSDLDSCVYYFMNQRKMIIASLFVDDFLVFTNSIDFYCTLKTGLSKRIPVKDLGMAQKCLGINVKIDRNQGTIELNQTDYIDSILQRFNMGECKGASTPMEPGSVLNASTYSIKSEETERLQKIPYQNAVGALLYLVQATRPDLTYAVSSVSRYNNAYDESNWVAVKRIMCYLHCTRDYNLKYSRDTSTEAFGYCDASWAADY